MNLCGEENLLGCNMINFQAVKTAQLREIYKILVAGVSAKAESGCVGERCEDNVLEMEKKMSEIIDKTIALESEIKSLKEERDALASDKAGLEEKASQVDVLTQELNGQKQELESLREFKRLTEEAAEKAERIKTIKAMLGDAGVETDVDAEADYWLNMSEDVLKLTVSKMGELSKGAKASASIKIPQLHNEDVDTVQTVRDGLKKLKNGGK